MKNILVGIDFSKGSLQVLDYAISLANIIKADVIMLWIDKLLESDNNYVQAEQHDLKEETSLSIAEILEEYAPRLISGKLHYKIRKGKMYSEIAIQAKLSKSSLIVTDTNGSIGVDEYWVGNNAFRVVKSAPCPVITIHPKSESRINFDHILLPIDTTSYTMQKVPLIIELAGLLGSEIHILGLNATGLLTLQKKVDDNVRKTEQLLMEQKIIYTTEMIKNSNITKTILSYADKIEAGLIAIMTEQEPSESSLMMGPQAQHIINMSEVPVLNIQPRK